MRTKLTYENILAIKAELRQILQTYFFVGIVLVLVFFPVVFISDGKLVSPDFWEIHPILRIILFVVFSFYLLFLYLSSKSRIRDLICGNKIIETKKLLNKEIEERYPSSYRVKVNVKLESYPPMIVYKLVFADQIIEVTKEAFDTFNIGENIKLSKTIYTQSIVQMES